MPFSENEALKVFISYASEDQSTADVLKVALKAAFNENIEITMMSEFVTGLNWRGIIQKSISGTDVMIVVATGRLKPSHSFTGAEVGAFGQSIFTHPMMARWPSLQRRIIPFAVLARVPDTVNEFEGVNIDPSSLRDVRFDPTTLDDNLKRLQSEQKESQPSSLKFLLDIQDLLDSRSENSRISSIVKSRERIEILYDIAAKMTKEVVSQILVREKDTQRPKAKLIIRTGPGAAQLGRSISIADTTIELVGDFSRIFGLNARSGRKYNWLELVNDIDHDISLQWNKALHTLITSNGDSVYLNDNSIISFDGKRLYRIFTSSIVTYYDETVEYHVYAIEVLHERECGHKETSLMLHAVEVSLGYRFMFLEKMSQFSPEAFGATAPNDLAKRTSDMIDHLTMLLLKSEQYQLSDPHNILLVMGSEALEQIGQNYVTWNDAKRDIYSCAKSILSKKTLTPNDQAFLLKTVYEFRDKTAELNKCYTNAVIAKLQKMLTDASQEVLLPKEKTKPYALVS